MASNSPTVEQYREQATKLVIGESWVYGELAEMPTWRESVDKVAKALQSERRAGMLVYMPSAED